MAPPKSIPLPTTMLQPKKKAINFAETPVTIRVGEPPTTYTVNKQFLCSASEYFRAALGPSWVEGKTGVVDMPDDDADAFNVYLNWLHTRSICFDFSSDDDDAEYEYGADRSSIIMAYALGDKLLDACFKDAITDAVAEMLSMMRPGDRIYLPLYQSEMTMAYEKLARDSKLNLLIVHQAARARDASELVRESDPAGFLFNFAHELIQIAKEERPEKTKDAVARCVFHEHEPGACYRMR